MLQMVRTSQSSDAASKAADMRGGASKSGANAFSGSPLDLRVHALLSDSGTPAAEDSFSEKRAPSVDSQSTPDNESSASASPRTSLHTPAATVPACIQQGIGRKSAALAIEEGTYEGLPAFLVVLPHQSDATLVQAYVIDAGCVQADPTGKGELLLSHAYARR